jgi:hypothetical protein
MRSITCLLITLDALGAGCPALTRREALAASEPITYTVGQHAALVDAMDRFADHGLELTEVRVQFWADEGVAVGTRHCTAASWTTGPTRSTSAPPSPTTWFRRSSPSRGPTLLHELAHVWVENAVDDTTKAEFLALRGLSARDSGPWADRGAEHTAEVLAWAVSGGERTVWQFEASDTAAMERAYLVLTGA